MEKSVCPDRETLDRAELLVVEMLKDVKYEMVGDCLSLDNVQSIIDSSRIDSAKSPGYPYLDDGFTTNGDVIAAGGLAEKVLHSIGKPSPSNLFGKYEATKLKKIQDSMHRLVHGVGLNDQIKTHAYFGNFNDALVANYRKSPIMVGWSPLKPTDGDWFFRTMNRGKKYKIVQDDMKHWDYSYWPWLVQVVINVIIRLAVRSKNMTEEDAVEWKAGARKQLEEQFSLPFRLPDGTIVERLQAALMTSGSVITIAANSVGILVVDVVAKITMGLSNEYITQRCRTRVGGDDKTQSVPLDFDEKVYVAEMQKMGFEVHEAEVHPTMVGASFFSWKFGGDNIMPTWVPSRFTKHVISLQKTKLEDLPQALCAHMRNWCHDRKRFEWFWQAYFRGKEEYPELFDIVKLTDRKDLIQYLRGNESIRNELDVQDVSPQFWL